MSEPKKLMTAQERKIIIKYHQKEATENLQEVAEALEKIQSDIISASEYLDRFSGKIEKISRPGVLCAAASTSENFGDSPPAVVGTLLRAASFVAGRVSNRLEKLERAFGDSFKKTRERCQKGEIFYSWDPDEQRWLCMDAEGHYREESHLELEKNTEPTTSSPEERLVKLLEHRIEGYEKALEKILSLEENISGDFEEVEKAFFMLSLFVEERKKETNSPQAVPLPGKEEDVKKIIEKIGGASNRISRKASKALLAAYNKKKGASEGLSSILALDIKE